MGSDKQHSSLDKRIDHFNADERDLILNKARALLRKDKVSEEEINKILFGLFNLKMFEDNKTVDELINQLAEKFSDIVSLDRIKSVMDGFCLSKSEKEEEIKKLNNDLIQACKDGDIDRVRVLFEVGVELDATDGYGNSAKYWGHV